MNLVIDIGNSSAKVAVVHPHSGATELLETVPELTGDLLDSIFTRFPEIRKAILSTTRHTDRAVEHRIESRVETFIHFDASTPIPIGNRYETPQTLGPDRLAAAAGAWSLSEKGQELLIIDFGSAITIDRVNAEGDYLGGNISPGLEMRFEALHRLTDKLPLLSAYESGTDHYEITGKNTQEAIAGGVILGITYEIDGYIDRICEKNSRFSLFFTGRDANFFADKVKKPIFVICDLVIKGLNSILEYNTQHEDKQE